MKRTMILAGLSVALAGTVIAPAAASAEERTCRGTIGAATLDNVRVPSGALCTLNGTRVKGTIKVENGGRLRATAVRVVGNVQGEGHRRVRRPPFAGRRQHPARSRAGRRWFGATGSPATCSRSATGETSSSPATGSTATSSASRTSRLRGVGQRRRGQQGRPVPPPVTAA